MNKLNILVEIGHPAHVHFFMNPIAIWKTSGHKVFIVTRDKEITHRLLDEFGLTYLPLSKKKTGFFLMALELIIRWVKTLYFIKRHQIDLAISICGITTALPARLCGIPSITDTDTEDATLSNKIAFLFSDIIITPASFLKRPQHANVKTYEAFHELSYLHPARFSPESKFLRLFGLRENEKYLILRLVNWKAIHDRKRTGLSGENLMQIIHTFSSRGFRLFISSERRLPAFFDSYLIKHNFSKILHLIAFSSGYIGESPTMATEAAILGKPSVLISSRGKKLGYIVELQKKYGIVFNFDNYKSAEGFLKNQMLSEKTEEALEAGVKKLLEDKIDIAGWLAEFAVNYANQRHT